MKQFYLKTLVLLLLNMVGGSAYAYNCVVDGIYYNLNSLTEEATVTYKYDEKLDGICSDAYIGNVVIPSRVTYKRTVYSVTTIGHDAFRSCTDLTSVTIPNSVIDIGHDAFRDCS